MGDRCEPIGDIQAGHGIEDAFAGAALWSTQSGPSPLV